MQTIMRSCLILFASWGALAQSPASPIAFDAVSIKPSPPPGPNRSIFVGGPRRDPGRVTFSNIPIKYVIGTAYGIETNARIEGGPSWIDSEMYDIVGTLPAATTSDQVLVMLQTLLAERCKLAVRHEARDQAVYAFVIAKDGPKLKSHDPLNQGNGNRSSRGHLELHNVTLTQLGNFLQNELGRPVVDGTGLAGKYDVVLDWTPADTPIDDPKANAPSLTSAVQEKLGLKLMAQRAPIKYLVIDYVEKPGEN
jgi:uncharacterized protein (TIGR03435 family)